MKDNKNRNLPSIRLTLWESTQQPLVFTKNTILSIPFSLNLSRAHTHSHRNNSSNNQQLQQAITIIIKNKNNNNNRQFYLRFSRTLPFFSAPICWSLLPCALLHTFIGCASIALFALRICIWIRKKSLHNKAKE